MTIVTLLGVFCTHAQKKYGKGLEMKSTYILNILVLLFFCIYSKSGLNDTQYNDIKCGVGEESARFDGIVNG